MITEQDIAFLQHAINLAEKGIEQGGGPFGCLIVKDGRVIGEGSNRVTLDHDPTAHAEVEAIRDACRRLGSWQLTDCDLYASCEPCPMCLGAIYWARPRRVVFASTRLQAADAGFDDALIYREIDRPMALRQIPFELEPRPEAEDLFERWKKREDRKMY